jgi:hypothetical protein
VKNQPTAPLLLFVLAVIALVGIIGLTMTRHDVPQVLEFVVTATVGGAAGASIPSRASTLPVPTPEPRP